MYVYIPPSSRLLSLSAEMISSHRGDFRATQLSFIGFAFVYVTLFPYGSFRDQCSGLALSNPPHKQTAHNKHQRMEFYYLFWRRKTPCIGKSACCGATTSEEWGKMRGKIHLEDERLRARSPRTTRCLLCLIGLRIVQQAEARHPSGGKNYMEQRENRWCDGDKAMLQHTSDYALPPPRSASLMLQRMLGEEQTECQPCHQ